MTVTLDLDPALIARAKAQAARNGTTLTQFVERLVKDGMTGAVEPATTDAHTAAAPTLEARYEDRHGRPLPFPVLYGGTGFGPGIDPCSNASLLAAANKEEDEKYLRFFRGNPAGE